LYNDSFFFKKLLKTVIF